MVGGRQERALFIGLQMICWKNCQNNTTTLRYVEEHNVVLNYLHIYVSFAEYITNLDTTVFESEVPYLYRVKTRHTKLTPWSIVLLERLLFVG